MFGWINKRCEEATGRTTVSFDTIFVVLVGELSSITDKVLYHTKPEN